MIVLLTILFYLFITIGLINLIHFAMFVVGANIYDMQAFIRVRKNRRVRRVEKPLVSVLIPAYNEEKVIARSLQSVWNNTYDNIEIIVINDGSKDGTIQAVHNFIQSKTRSYRKVTPQIVRSKNGLKRVWHRGQTPIERRIKLVNKANGGKASALNTGLRYHTKGRLIMSLDADSLIHKNAIANTIKYFDDPKVVGVAANVRIIEDVSVLGILQRFEHMIGYRSKKFFTVTNCELIVGGVASTYRREILEEVGYYDTDTITEDIGLSMKIAAQGNRGQRLVYAADVTAMTEGVDTFNALLKQRYRWKLGNLQNLIKYRHIAFSAGGHYTKMLSWYRVPMAFIGEFLLLLDPLVLGYVLYLSIRFATIGLVMGAYTTITLYILLVIWPDEHLSLGGKLKASFYAPLLYFIFYVMNVIQVTSIIRCLVNNDQVLHLSSGKGSHWVSPERSGKKAVSFS